MIIKETYLDEIRANLALSAGLIYGSKSFVLAVTSREGRAVSREHVMSYSFLLPVAVVVWEARRFSALHFTHA
jgi:hypothetical protein